MKVEKTQISEVLLITPDIHEDHRGYFFESFNDKDFLTLSGTKFKSVQDNQSFSKKGTLRGLHFQIRPMAQAKIIQVIDGEIYDVAVDMRRESNTYCQWVAEYLSSDNHKQLYIPEGFAHAFLVVSNYATVIYKVNNYYSPEHEKVIRYDDPKINIKWPSSDIILSKRDSVADSVREESIFF